jgi:hypothetical protein
MTSSQHYLAINSPPDWATVQIILRAENNGTERMWPLHRTSLNSVANNSVTLTWDDLSSLVDKFYKSDFVEAKASLQFRLEKDGVAMMLCGEKRYCTRVLGTVSTLNANNIDTGNPFKLPLGFIGILRVGNSVIALIVNPV